MKGYIYTMYEGADPGKGWEMTDPIFGDPPTLGACMPQIRKQVQRNDHIFTISGRTKDVKQYIVGGFQVEEKINAIIARERFPQYQQRQDEEGNIVGNIIVDKNGEQNKFDYHKGNFQKRIENYIIGKNPTLFQKPDEVERARGEASLKILRDLFDKEGGEKPHDIIGRWRRLEQKQIERLLAWMEEIKHG
jgi:hypothetical protein